MIKCSNCMFYAFFPEKDKTLCSFIDDWHSYLVISIIVPELINLHFIVVVVVTVVWIWIVGAISAAQNCTLEKNYKMNFKKKLKKSIRRKDNPNSSTKFDLTYPEEWLPINNLTLIDTPPFWSRIYENNNENEVLSTWYVHR